jgi:adenylate kinase
VLVQRLLARSQAQGRSDDTEEVIRRRLRIFEEATAPLLAYYRDEGLARVVDATRSPDEITEVILALAAADAP